MGDRTTGSVTLSRSYDTISHWFTEVGAGGVTRQSLSGPREADVCIVGAGFTGLWTTYELMRADPALDVVVVESEVVGFGASGRNGGWVSGEMAGRAERLARNSSRNGVIQLYRAAAETVEEIGRVIERESIACDFVLGGTLHVAQTLPELDRVRALVEHDREWGLGPEDSMLLDRERARARVAVDRVLGARFFTHCARVQPAALARGLAEAAERAGATIYEHSHVDEIQPGVVITRNGSVKARYIVRATEAYTARLPGLRRVLVPLNSTMIVTEPLDAKLWRELGWARRETLLDGPHRYVYLQRTADDRIAIGGRGNPYRYASATDREGAVAAKTIAALSDRLTSLFPSLEGVEIAGSWHGVLGVPRDWTPKVWLERTTGLAWAGGYVGQGVAAANLAGRTLRDLLLGHDSELTRLPWVRPMRRKWEPEPMRFIGIHAVNALLLCADRRERRSQRSALAARWAHLVSGQDF